MLWPLGCGALLQVSLHFWHPQAAHGEILFSLVVEAGTYWDYGSLFLIDCIGCFNKSFPIFVCMIGGVLRAVPALCARCAQSLYMTMPSLHSGAQYPEQ